MESPVFFTSTVSPVCLPPAGSNDLYTDKDAAVIGWGALKEGNSGNSIVDWREIRTNWIWTELFKIRVWLFLGGSQPTALQQVTVQVITNERCKNNYGSDAPGGIVDHMLCAAYPGKDSCSVSASSVTVSNRSIKSFILGSLQGDSGGPLLVQSSPGSPWIQAGIVSWGIGCAQAKYPGVYARVTSFMNWIGKNTVWGR